MILVLKKKDRLISGLLENTKHEQMLAENSRRSLLKQATPFLYTTRSYMLTFERI